MKTVSLMPPERFKLCFPYLPDDVGRVRTLKGHRWHPELKAEGKPWSCDANEKNLELLTVWGFTADETITQWKKGPAKTKKIRPIKTVPGFKGQLRPFQQEGVAFLEQVNGKGLIADDMGLGKTVQTLAWLQLRPDALPALVVCPTGLKSNWASETKKFTDIRTQIIHGTQAFVPRATRGGRRISIINYEIMKDWGQTLKSMYKTIVLDESHRIKNPSAKRTKATLLVARKAKHVIALSGTPILNDPAEFYTVLNLLNPVEFDSWFAFGMRYCDPKERNGVLEFNGASNLDELAQKLSPIMIRRLKKDVLKDLPAKNQMTVLLDLTKQGMKMYREAKRKVFGKLSQYRGGLAKVQAIGALRQAAVEAKMELVVDRVEETMKNEGKLILFVVHHSTTDLLLKHFPDALVMDGRTPKKQRSEIEALFQTSKKHRLLIANIDVGGIGLNLTAAETVIFVEQPWTPGLRDQAEDRAYRIGQTKEVFVYYLVAKGTLEEDIMRLIYRKEGVVNGVMNNHPRQVDALFEQLKQKE